jgi:hypothetical protein
MWRSNQGGWNDGGMGQREMYIWSIKPHGKRSRLQPGHKREDDTKIGSLWKGVELGNGFSWLRTWSNEYVMNPRVSQNPGIFFAGWMPTFQGRSFIVEFVIGFHFTTKEKKRTQTVICRTVINSFYSRSVCRFILFLKNIQTLYLWRNSS